MKKSIEIFFSYAPEDEQLLKKLIIHLKGPERDGLIRLWHDQNISPGTTRQDEITSYLNEADIILLLVSPDFLASDDHHNEMKRAMDQQRSGEAHVIPIILRPVDWKDTSFGELQVLPKNEKPITRWESEDEAFEQVAKQIKLIAENLPAEHYGKGKALMGKGDYDKALEAYDRAIFLDPTNPQFYQGKGEVYEHLAQQAYEQAQQTWANKLTMLHKLTKHSDLVRSVAISPDGQTLISGSQDKTIKVWNLHTGQLLDELKGHSGSVHNVAISPDGQTVVSGGTDKTIRVWNLHTGQLLRELKGHSGAIRPVTVSPYGRTLVSGGQDKTIKVWNLHTGQLLRELRGHSGVVVSIAISPDGRTLVSGSGDKTIRVWNLHTGQLLRILAEHNSAVHSVAISHGGQILASGSTDKTIQVWRIQ